MQEPENYYAHYAFPQNIADLIDAVSVYKRCAADFVVRDADPIIALFTLILGIATIILAVATGRLVRGAEETAERQLRAYAGVGDPVKINRLSSGTQPRFTMRFRNFGNTPAYELRGRHEVKCCDHPLSVDMPISEFEPDRRVLNPGETYSTIVDGDMTLTEADMEALRSDTKRLYLFGALRYRDAFGAVRNTRYQMFYVPSLGAMVMSEKNNDAD